MDQAGAVVLEQMMASSSNPDYCSENQTLSFFSEYIDAQVTLQNVTNPSSTGQPLSGLGEPKFYGNCTTFLGPWGRPQPDEPALRALATLKYIERMGDPSIENKTIQLLRADLDYVSAFDLWEEVQGSSFFTTISHLHALSLGSDFFAQNGDQKRAETYMTAAEQVYCFAQEYWLENEGAFNWNIENGVNRSGLDANSILATLLSPFDSTSSSFSPSGPCDSSLFTPCSDRMLVNHKAVVDSFRGLYALEGEQQDGSAIAIGRYREDVYYSGNPWYLTTLAAAEQLYLALSTW
ncbi:SPOSA6832_04291 [Sporobolomyces salmonicolor]|uniref:1,4-alpha-D-glucan glucohydrolase n=1 Tax=Sporidiobolus salmonicolor TaxID=5005 RepID=A0A0D6ERK4_SPOSA|nr:SPOSA6832_04291 [Sporobolomyces salmonicolor]